MLKSGENGLIGPGSNDYGKNDKYYNFFSQKDHGGFSEEFLKEQLKKANDSMKSTNDIPRRSRLDLCTPAELAIYNAVQKVEEVGCDVKLTEAVILLAKARNLVADYIDNELQKQNL